MPLPTITPITEIPSRSTAPNEDVYAAQVETLLEQELPGLTTELAAFGPAFNADVATVGVQAAQVASDTLVATSAAEAAQESWESAIAGDFGLISGASTTSLAIGIGTKTLTANTGKNWWKGQAIDIRSAASPVNAMIGEVMSYNRTTGALVVQVFEVQGTGTFASWVILPAGSRGYVGRGFTLLSTPPLTAATVSIVIADVPQIYEDLRIEIIDWQFAAGQASIEASLDNGATWPSLTLWLGDAGETRLNGVLDLVGYRRFERVASQPSIYSGNSALPVVPNREVGRILALASPINAIRLRTNGAAGSSSGTIKLWGR